MILCACMYVHTCVLQLDDECADSGRVSVTDCGQLALVSWAQPWAAFPKESQSALAVKHTHTHTHTCTRIFPGEYVPLVAGRPWFDRERLAPLSCVLIRVSSLLLPGRSRRGFTRHLWHHTHTHTHTHTYAYTCRPMLCWNVFAIYLILAYFDLMYLKISPYLSKFSRWQSSHCVSYNLVCTIDYVRMKDLQTIILHFC